MEGKENQQMQGLKRMRYLNKKADRRLSQSVCEDNLSQSVIQPRYVVNSYLPSSRVSFKMNTKHLKDTEQKINTGNMRLLQKLNNIMEGGNRNNRSHSRGKSSSKSRSISHANHILSPDDEWKYYINLAPTFQSHQCYYENPSTLTQPSHPLHFTQQVESTDKASHLTLATVANKRSAIIRASTAKKYQETQKLEKITKENQMLARKLIICKPIVGTVEKWAEHNKQASLNRSKLRTIIANPINSAAYTNDQLSSINFNLLDPSYFTLKPKYFKGEFSDSSSNPYLIQLRERPNHFPCKGFIRKGGSRHTEGGGDNILNISYFDYAMKRPQSPPNLSKIRLEQTTGQKQQNLTQTRTGIIELNKSWLDKRRYSAGKKSIIESDSHSDRKQLQGQLVQFHANLLTSGTFPTQVSLPPLSELSASEQTTGSIKKVDQLMIKSSSETKSKESSKNMEKTKESSSGSSSPTQAMRFSKNNNYFKDPSFQNSSKASSNAALSRSPLRKVNSLSTSTIIQNWTVPESFPEKLRTKKILAIKKLLDSPEILSQSQEIEEETSVDLQEAIKKVQEKYLAAAEEKQHFIRKAQS